MDPTVGDIVICYATMDGVRHAHAAKIVKASPGAPSVDLELVDDEADGDGEPKPPVVIRNVAHVPGAGEIDSDPSWS